MSGRNWMGKYIMGRDLSLSEIVMPGSHDAGVFEDQQTNAGILGSKKAAICQSGGLKSQLEAGSRLFDLRARLVRQTNLIGDGNSPFEPTTSVDKGRVRFYHGGKKLGTKGGGVAEQLEEVKAFLQDNRTEFCILRFTKTQCPNAVTNLVNEILGDLLYTAGGNLAKHKVDRMQGRVIAVFDGSFNYHNQRTGFHNYAKKEACESGLGIAGSYAGSRFARLVVRNQTSKLKKYVKKNLSGDRLYAWYQTQTYSTNIKSTTSGGVGSRARVKSLRDKLKNDADYESINIVMMDFVDNYKCRHIYRRNDPLNGRDFGFDVT
ncbi:MAG: hypothetical protein L3J28_04505 [Candidatus Polarisedimenticolaceae bacterium]|nr:hypothetical protein [Candidatus Polarisedimenticolaceae bacterium]